MCRKLKGLEIPAFSFMILIATTAGAQQSRCHKDSHCKNAPCQIIPPGDPDNPPPGYINECNCCFDTPDWTCRDNVPCPDCVEQT